MPYPQANEPQTYAPGFEWDRHPELAMSGAPALELAGLSGMIDLDEPRVVNVWVVADGEGKA